MGGARTRAGQVALVAFWLAALFVNTALHAYVFAAIAGLFFLWRGSELAYSLATSTPTPGRPWRPNFLVISDATWSVSAGAGAVLLLGLALFAAFHPRDVPGELAFALFGLGAWGLGWMRRARQHAAVPVDPS